ncbi:YmfL family putative regulatory protein [Pantoea agglomerans]|uniref:YmfL family putative regulatory protein n=1 Tax=Enterobacter agglomerans TaxID=549 RepID=UPI000534C702|nr:YmfL family putative regulatory protein [Pantoea agglomerans]
MQPDWYVNAVRDMITSLSGGYEEAVSWIGKKKSRDDDGTSVDSLLNRLRGEGDQIFPLGWAILLQRAGGTRHIADAVAKASGGVFVPLPDVELVDYGDINQRLLEAIEQITRYSQQVRAAIEDGVVEPHEREVIDEELHRAITKLQEHTTLVYRVFCAPEK